MRALWRWMKQSDQRLFDWGDRKDGRVLQTHVDAVGDLLKPDEAVEVAGHVLVGSRLTTISPFLMVYFQHLLVLTNQRVLLFKISPWNRRPGAVVSAAPRELSVRRVRRVGLGRPLSVWVEGRDGVVRRLNFTRPYTETGDELLRRLEQAA